MSLRRVAAVMAVACLVAGCDLSGIGGYVSSAPQDVPLPATPPKMPRYGDALAGLYAMPASRLPSDLPLNYYAPGGGTGKPGRAVLTMALVPGANYAKLRDYLGQASIALAGAAPQTRGSAQGDLQLSPVVKQAVDIVKQRYPWIEFADDLSAAQKRDVSLTLVLDIRTRLARVAGEATAVQIEIVAFNDHHKPVAHFLSEGRATAGGPNGYNFTPAAQQALTGLAQKSTAYFD